MTKKRKPNRLTVQGKPNEDEAAALARTVTRPAVLAAISLKEYGKAFGDVDVSGLVDCLTKQSKAIKDGDLARGEEMLTA